jgi:hypothetical protein
MPLAKTSHKLFFDDMRGENSGKRAARYITKSNMN